MGEHASDLLRQDAFWRQVGGDVRLVKPADLRGLVAGRRPTADQRADEEEFAAGEDARGVALFRAVPDRRELQRLDLEAALFERFLGGVLRRRSGSRRPSRRAGSSGRRRRVSRTIRMRSSSSKTASADVHLGGRITGLAGEQRLDLFDRRIGAGREHAGGELSVWPRSARDRKGRGRTRGRSGRSLAIRAPTRASRGLSSAWPRLDAGAGRRSSVAGPPSHCAAWPGSTSIACARHRTVFQQTAAPDGLCSLMGQGRSFAACPPTDCPCTFSPSKDRRAEA